MREVRWIIQVSQPGVNDWRNNEDTYSGWFYSDGVDEPTESLLRDYKEAVEKYEWLDVRLIQENRSFSTKELNITRRKVRDD